MIKAQLIERLERLTSQDRELIRLKLGEFLSEKIDPISSEVKNRLVAYIEPREGFEMDTVVSYLKSMLPDYMIPAPIVVVDEFPRLPNGKIDRSGLKEIEKESQSIKGIQEPRTEMEKNLLDIWEEVMNFSPISTDDNFFEIGGDSILSIQIIAKARKRGIAIKPNQLFEHQTITELSSVLSHLEEPTGPVEILSGEITLTPIQEWFFETHKKAPNYWNQIVKLTRTKDVDANYFKKVILALADHHDSLRLNFNKESDGWKAIIQSSGIEDQCIVTYDLSTIRNAEEQELEIEGILRKSQQESALSTTPLFRQIHFKCAHSQEDKFFLIGHHLLVDHVSWNLILEDINLGLEQVQRGEQIHFGPKISTVKDWSEFLDEYSGSEKILAELPYWRKRNSSAFKLPIDEDRRQNYYTEESALLIRATLDAESSQHLKDKANLAFNTRADELIISALVKTLAVWSDRSEVMFGMEKHGRPPGLPQIDVSNTVGWFTSFFPVLFHYSKDESISSLIKMVKEETRNIPVEGIGFGVLKYKSGYYKELIGDPEIVFNYLGHQGKSDDGNVITFEYDNAFARDPQNERSYALEINTYFLDNQLQIECWYATEVLDSESIAKLLENLKENIIEVVETCLSTETKDFTPSDFPDIEISQEDLDNLLSNL